MKEDTSNEEIVEETVEETPETIESEPSSQLEEPPKETPRKYAGKYNSPEDLEKAYSEAQKLISQQGQKIKEYETPQLPPDKQEIQNELKNLGFVTKEEFFRQQAVENQKAKDEAEIRQLQLDETQANALRKYASHKDNLSKSMTECWDELIGSIGGKVISRKTTLKPKKGTVEGFKEKTPQELSRLPKEEYDKYWADYANYQANQ